MILALVLMLIVGAQSCAVSVGESLGNEPAKTQGGALGTLIALLFLVGGAFALAFPLASLVVFVLAALVGIGGGSSSSFTDLTYWGWVSLALAVLSYFGCREKRKRRSESASRVQ